MKKQYGVAPINQKEYVDSATDVGGSGAVNRPLLKFTGDFNPQIVAGEFSLPPAKETQEATLEVAHRILGILVTKDLLAHLPPTVTSEHLGNLLPFMPFAYHKRFGFTYTDRVCPASTRTGRCPICAGRKELFTSDAYKNGTLAKDDIIKNGGFGQRMVALVISRVYFNGEDLGIRAWTTNLTNEEAKNAKHDNFFDLVAQLMTPKKMLAGETLPIDYYANGDGARWLIAEYVRATYQEEGGKGDQKSKRGPAPYWKLSKITPTKEIEGVGKARDIWWPDLGKGKDAKDAKDAIEVVDVYGLLDHTPAEELEKVAKEKVDSLLHPRKERSETGATKPDGGAEAKYEDVEPPTWQNLLDADVATLVEYGVARGGIEADLELAGATNEAALRRCVASMWGVKPTMTRKPTEQADASDNENMPF